jgi:hypothetical protein
MKYCKFLIFLITVSMPPAMVNSQDVPETEEIVIFYNTYGYQDGGNWIIPMRAYVMEQRDYMENSVTSLVRRLRSLDQDQEEIFRSRIKDFVADSESREEVQFRFDNDPEQKTYFIQNEGGSPALSNTNGFVDGELKLPIEEAERLLQYQDSKNGRLTFYAVSDEHSGRGTIQLISPEGLSVISDIDDTVKITELPAGRDVVIRNTFFKPYSAATGMAGIYNEWQNAAFHYVSGAPWQLYRPLTEFLFSEEEGFPPGSLHMKEVTKNLRSLTTWRNLGELATNENITYDQKIRQISTIMSHFPNRDFILVGDSGERDPEVYSAILELYPDRVKEIFIRDVVNDRELNPERLRGMTILEAPTITYGTTQFDR